MKLFLKKSENILYLTNNFYLTEAAKPNENERC